MALISDAGTPILSDPGERLVTTAIAAGIVVVAIPGASALLSALVVSGLSADRFTFFGFLPRSGGERRAAIAELTELEHTAVLYEAPGRVAPTLADIEAAGGGDRPAAVAREMTKQFEETRRGTVAELRTYYKDNPPRGEVVIVLGGAPERVVDEARDSRARACVARTGDERERHGGGGREGAGCLASGGVSADTGAGVRGGLVIRGKGGMVNWWAR